VFRQPTRGRGWPTESRRPNLGVSCLAGRLEDNATPNLDRVVGEAFVKPAQQRNIYGGLHTVRPFLFFEQSEQVLVKFVDDFIVVADLRCPFGITRQHKIFGAVAQIHGGPAHLGETVAYLGGQCVAGVPAADDLGNVSRTLPPHALLRSDGALPISKGCSTH
jgi:hypothetical protein